MSGIFGCFSRMLNDNKVNAFVDALIKSGFNVECQYLIESCLLGKINFSSASKTTCVDDSNNICIVFYGEIYNENIENFDEFLVEIYKERRLDRLIEVNGSFIAAIYDTLKEKMTIVNDRYGLIKLYYYFDEDLFCFAPKIKPLLSMASNKLLKRESIVDFFLFGYLLGDNTFFRNVMQLNPGSILEISNGNLKLSRYRDYEYAEIPETKTREELISQLDILWQNAVQRRTKLNRSIIIPLSGGLDSRAILAAALRCISKEDITTFTYGEKGSFDFEIGQIVAKESGVRNIPLAAEKINFEEKYKKSFYDIEGMIDATPYFAVDGYEGIKNYGNVIFSGTMIDVLLGRHILSNIFSPDLLKKEILSKTDQMEINKLIFNRQKLNDEAEIVQLFSQEFLKDMDIMSSFSSTHPQFENIKNKRFPDYFAAWDYNHRWNKYVYFAVFRKRDLFRYMTMLDSDLVDFTLKLSPEFRLDENLYIDMLLQRYPELFKIPTKTNSGLNLDANRISIFTNKALIRLKKDINRLFKNYLKRNIFLDKSRNYLDYNELLRTNEEYRNYFRKMISRVEERDYFSQSYIESIWKAHLQGKKDYIGILGLLVTFELFLEEFVDE